MGDTRLSRTTRPEDTAAEPFEWLPQLRLGSVFVLAAGGLRRLHGRGESFLGYSATQMFWTDMLDLVHEEDVPLVKDLISEAVKSPGTSLSAPLLFKDSSGAPRLMDAYIRNVLEAPGDVGLVIADVSDPASAHTESEPPEAGLL